jgi:hypothetical protein
LCVCVCVYVCASVRVYIIVYDLENSTLRKPRPELGCCATEYIYIYIYLLGLLPLQFLHESCSVNLEQSRVPFFPLIFFLFDYHICS